MRRLGQTGIADAGGVLMGARVPDARVQPAWWLAPLAVLAIGLGFYMLHNTLQTDRARR